ncbi:MAG: hypothetical protein SVU32_08890 [Candidatus Nanohaloarchaea archaeon]|nr:hypothetical protein [Candidatus Nanohaloarchaea archaeon]
MADLHYDDADDLEEFQWQFYADMADELDGTVSGTYPSSSDTIWLKLSPFEKMLVRQQDEAFAAGLDEYTDLLDEYRSCGDVLEDYLDPLFETLPDDQTRDGYHGRKVIDDYDHDHSLLHFVSQFEEELLEAGSADAFALRVKSEGALSRYDDVVDGPGQAPYRRIWDAVTEGEPNLRTKLATVRERETMLAADIEYHAEQLCERLEGKVGDEIVSGPKNVSGGRDMESIVEDVIERLEERGELDAVVEDA